MEQLDILVSQPGALVAALQRIEAKLDALIDALADESESPMVDLEGRPAGAERDARAPL